MLDKSVNAFYTESNKTYRKTRMPKHAQFGPSWFLKYIKQTKNHQNMVLTIDLTLLRLEMFTTNKIDYFDAHLSVNKKIDSTNFFT